MEIQYVIAWFIGFSVVVFFHYILIHYVLRVHFFYLYQKNILRDPENINFSMIYLITLIGFLVIIMIALVGMLQLEKISPVWAGISIGFFIALISTAAWLNVHIPYSVVWLISANELISFSVAGFIISMII